MISRDSLKGITSVIAVGLAIFQIYFTAGFGIIDSQLLRTITGEAINLAEAGNLAQEHERLVSRRVTRK